MTCRSNRPMTRPGKRGMREVDLQDGESLPYVIADILVGDGRFHFEPGDLLEVKIAIRGKQTCEFALAVVKRSAVGFEDPCDVPPSVRAKWGKRK